MTIDERIAKEREKIRQLMRKKKAQEKREFEAKRKQDTRRQIIIGKLMIEHFPELLKLTPRLSNAETESEFSIVNKILEMLSGDAEYVKKLTEKARMLNS